MGVELIAIWSVAKLPSSHCSPAAFKLEISGTAYARCAAAAEYEFCLIMPTSRGRKEILASHDNKEFLGRISNVSGCLPWKKKIELGVFYKVVCVSCTEFPNKKKKKLNTWI